YHSLVFVHHYLSLFFFHHPPTTEIYTLSLHDALPILHGAGLMLFKYGVDAAVVWAFTHRLWTPLTYLNPVWTLREELLRDAPVRSEEHTSELQSRGHLVCRLLLEKKKKEQTTNKEPNE